MCEDPHWEEYSGLEECQLGNPHYLVQKLCELLKDDTAKKMIHRHLILIDGYLRLSTDGFLLSDLSLLMVVLECLSERLGEVCEYREALTRILQRCRLPPLLAKSSDVLCFSVELEQYFTLLGYLVATIDGEELQLLVLEVLQCLLTSFMHRKDPARVRLDHCLAAMERSLLPTTLAELVEIAYPAVLPEILSVALICVNASQRACKRMVCARALDGIFYRMDPNYATRDVTQPPDRSALYAKATRTYEQLMPRACAMLWALLGSLQTAPHSCLCKGNPSQAALWCLDFVLRYETIRGNVRRRNDLVGIITLALSVLPEMLVVESNIAEDLVLLAVGSEVGTAGTWAENVVFSPTIDDLHLKRMLLLAVCHLLQRQACIELFAVSGLMPGLLALLPPGLPTALAQPVSWTPPQSAKLLVYALRAIGFLACVLEEQFLHHHGPARLMQLVRATSDTRFADDVAQTLLRTLARILSAEHVAVVDAFRTADTVSILLAFCARLVDPNTTSPGSDGDVPEALTAARQRVVTLALFVLEILVRNHEPTQLSCAAAARSLVRSACARIVQPRDFDTCTDHRMLIALVDFLWEAIIWCPQSHDQFVAEGGVYSLLDMMQCSGSVSVKCIFLSALCDLAERGACVVHLVTWRDPNARNVGYVQALANAWREEEIQRRALRTPEGVVSDIERPLMGEDQWYHTFFRKKDAQVSPAIADMFGSVRPKVYSILQVLKQRQSERMEMAQAHYRMDYLPLSTSDKITLQLARNFLALKIGEVWAEVAMDIATLGLKPIGAVGEVISTMTKRQMQWASTIQGHQRDVLMAARKKEAAEEKAFYRGQCEARLAPTLEALRELEFIARTSDQVFRLACKDRQMCEVDHSLEWPDDLGVCRHRTYLPNNNVTVLTGQSMHVISVDKKDAVLETCEPESKSLVSENSMTAIIDDVDDNK